MFMNNIFLSVSLYTNNTYSNEVINNVLFLDKYDIATIHECLRHLDLVKHDGHLLYFQFFHTNNKNTNIPIFLNEIANYKNVLTQFPIEVI